MTRLQLFAVAFLLGILFWQGLCWNGILPLTTIRRDAIEDRHCTTTCTEWEHR